MSSKVSSSRIIELAGKVKGKVRRLSTVCVRKNCIRPSMKKHFKTIKSSKTEVLGMVSHPTLTKSKTAPYVSAWCHPFRNPDEFISPKTPKILLSESDFVDPAFVRVSSRRDPKWDFFYFTMGGPKSGKKKGWPLFMQILPTLCGKYKMKGLVVNYTRKSLAFTSKEKKIWRKYKGQIDYKHEKIPPKKLPKLMARCRFGLFPNERDCSPLLMAESLIRNVPVFVNKDILGGWKYVNSQSGVFFDAGSIDESIDAMLTGDFGPRDYFMSEYGFYNAAKAMADFGRKHLKSFKDCELACFQGLSHILEKY